MEVNEILEKMRKEDRLLLESAVMLSVQKALIDMGYEPFEDKVRGVYTAIENTPIANSWIPCSERLPEPNKYCLVTYSVNGRLHVDAWIFNPGGPRDFPWGPT